ncbi:MFS general substrate transporter [Ramaria rubella]|nr:MFS general substrate transporter [Ramaria rubella]
MTSQDTRPLLSEDQPSYTDLNPQPEQNENEAIAGKPPAEEPKVRMLAILLPVSLGTFLAAMDGTIVASSYAAIGSDLKQLQNSSWVATGYMLTLTSFQPLYGKLSDIYGRKTCLLFAYFIFGLGCLCCGLARNMTELIAARVLSGIGGGGMTTVVVVLFSDLVPLRQRGTWQGILNIMYATGSASGAPLGGLIADSVGWRWSFLVQVPLTLIAFLSVLLALHPPARAASTLSTSSKLRRVDFLGAFTLVVAVFSLLLGLDRGSNTSWSSPLSYGPLVIALVMIFFFAYVEITPALAQEPLAPRHIIANPSLLGSYLAGFFGFASMMCDVFFAPLYAQAALGKSATDAGTILLPAIFLGVIGSLSAGLIMQRTGKYKRLTVSAAVIYTMGALVVYVMVMRQSSWSLVGVITGTALMQFGMGVVITTALIALIANVTPSDQAVATAISYLFRSLGSVIGISAGSVLVQHNLRVYLKARLSGADQDIDEIVRRVRESLSYVDSLDPVTRAIVRGTYEEALSAAFLMAAALAVCTLVSCLFIREKSLGGAK